MNDSNERHELGRMLPELVERDLPGDRRRQLQEFVMSQIHQETAEPAPRRTTRRRLVLATSGVAAVAAAAVAAAAIGTGGFGVARGKDRSTPPATGMSPVSQTFELAAAYAAARPFTPPRPDQWIYIQYRNLNPSAIAKDKGQKPVETIQTWKRADGKKMAGRNPDMNNRLEIWTQTSEYPTLSTLPTDPRTLLALLRTQLETAGSDVRGPNGDARVPANGRATPRTPEELNAALFSRIAWILDEYLLPPAVTAALWRAAALVPGVTQAPGTISIGGRDVTAVGRVQDGWRFEQLLVDPDTYEFVGYRSVAIKDHTYFPDSPNGGILEKKGSVQYTITRLAAAIVDAPGQTH